MKKSFITLFAILLFLVSWAQEGTIRGFVYEETTGEPVIFTNVYLDKTTLGSTTNENGYFSITDIPPGDYTLMITALGYDSLTDNISVQPGKIITKKYFVEKADKY
ncbi:MAG: carboxypeptidase-like regulatory domain-containing protein [Bacteroidota bacterium]